MIAPRLVISAGVVAMALASVGAHDTAKAYNKQQRYEAALGQLKTLLLLDPQHDEALTMKDLLEDTIQFRRERDIERETRRATADMQLRTDESQIPHPEEVTYPKNWRDIIAKPTRQPDEPIGLDKADKAVASDVFRGGRDGVGEFRRASVTDTTQLEGPA